MKKLLVPLFILTGFYCNSQGRIIFKVRYQPETNYNQTIDQSSETTVKYSGTEEFLRNLKTQGVDNPTISKVNSKTTAIFKAGKLTNGSLFPFSIRFVETINSGGKITIPNGTTIYGKSSLEDGPTLDSISGSLSNEVKKVVLQTMEKTFSQMIFPERKVQIGETFSRQSPLTLPLAGVTLDISITTTYKLINIKGNLAMFNISQVYTLKSTIKGNNVKITGNGKGNLIYDIENHFYKRYQTDTDMKANMKLDKFDLDLDTKSRLIKSVMITKG